ncbi:MAG TPA: hypothetical protein VLT13_12495, partial [Bacteroidota bacterium]|nr:hypothetical protein [Bacteroidota bacterium]
MITRAFSGDSKAFMPGKYASPVPTETLKNASQGARRKIRDRREELTMPVTVQMATYGQRGYGRVFRRAMRRARVS